MRSLFSRYGGHMVIIGKGKASREKLPEDQSLDNMLDNHSLEPVKNIFYLSSYRMQPEFMGNISPLPKGFVKLGVLNHLFMDLTLQHDVHVDTHIYIGSHGYPNVFALFIHTDEKELKYLFDFKDSNKSCYDYVLTFFFRGLIEGEDLLNKTPEIMEMMLFILVFEMELSYSEIQFTKSKTWLGKLISTDLNDRINKMLSAEDSEKALIEVLNTYKVKLSDKLM
jgi:hypothetical protein